jgi:hypothetical protein
MASRKRQHSSSSQRQHIHSVPTTATPTYTTLASLRDKLRASKKADRQAACKDLLEKLQDTSTIKRLEYEAQLMFDKFLSRGGGGGGTSLGNGTSGVGDGSSLYPRDRVSLLYRTLLEASLIAAQTIIEGEPGNAKHKNTANQTGLIKKSLKFTANDILFPYKVFLKIDIMAHHHLGKSIGKVNHDMVIIWILAILLPLLRLPQTTRTDQ